ncbi:MAG: hypothetical protein ABI611_07085 [Solirubrobacteraceae bacterium]
MKAALAVTLLAVAVAPATATAEFPGTSLQRLSAAPSRNPAISQDRRFARLAAFEADTGATTNVYVVRRAGGYGENGTPWHAGATVLASRGLGGEAANGPSTQPSLDGASRVAPHCVAFASDARNLSSLDGNHATDVYQRVMTRRYGPRIHGTCHQRLQMDTRLVSMAGNGRAGAGPSDSPASNVDGSVVAFVTTASNLHGTAGRTQVVKALLDRGRRPRLRLASRTSRRAPGNGPSTAPSVTAGGTWVLFESDATDIGLTTARSPDINGVRDAMLATEPSGERWLLGERGTRGPTTNPMTSPHGNYVVFERGGHAYLLYVGPK